MKNKYLFISEIIGVLIILFFATIAHDLYKIYPSFFTSILFPVNESPWEHTKLFFIPAILWYVFQYFVIGKYYKNYFVAHVISLFIMPAFMLIVYYAYLGLGFEEHFIFHIILTFLSILIGSTIAFFITVSKKNFSKYNKLTLVALIMLIGTYACLTYFPPKINLFRDSTNGGYGIVNSINN